MFRCIRTKLSCLLELHIMIRNDPYLQCGCKISTSGLALQLGFSFYFSCYRRRSLVCESSLLLYLLVLVSFVDCIVDVFICWFILFWSINRELHIVTIVVVVVYCIWFSPLNEYFTLKLRLDYTSGYRNFNHNIIPLFV